MGTGRLFSEFVKGKWYNSLYQTAEEYVNENWEAMILYTQNAHHIEYVGMNDATIERVYVWDILKMCVAFEVGLKLGIDAKEGEYHYNENNQCYLWLRIYCEGDLSYGFDNIIVSILFVQ